MGLLSTRYAQIGFWVPAGLAILASIVGIVIVLQDTSGYGVLVFFAFALYGLPAILLWLGVGAFVLIARGPAGAGKQFATGAAVALGVALLLFTTTCFGSLAL